MSKLRRALEIQRQEGIYTLINRSARYIKSRVHNQFWSRYYNIKAQIFGNHIVGINDVRIDLNSEVFSSEMKNRLRKKKYEQAEKIVINKYICSTHPTVDLGAGVGYTACLVDKKVNDSTPVIAVEANELLIPVLKRTKSLNQCRYDILHSAYDSTEDSIKFQVAEDFWSSSQYSRENKKQEEATVPAVSLNTIIDEYSLETPIQLIVDIEGGEHDLFINSQDTLQNKVSLIVFEYHSFTERSFKEYERILTKKGFEFVESQGNVYVYKNSKI
jgi:FkbM family methyltransferase